MYKQTKESFEQFLEECRMLAQNIKLPLAPHIGCPWCNGSSYLETQQFGHMIGEDAWRGTQYFYWCDNCKESYTTTDSDALSLATLKLIED